MKLDTGSYLKSAEVNTGESVTFRNEGEWVENTKFTYDDGTPKNDFVIGVVYRGADKRMRLNKTNRDNMIAAYGAETRDWVGKPAMIVKEKMLVAGKRMDVITLEVPAANNPLTDQDKADIAKDQPDIPF